MQTSQTKERNSSIELFRILSILLVIIVHFNGWFLANTGEKPISSIESIAQTLVTSLSAVCVNCFLIISGFYGLRLKIKSIWNIYITLISIYVPFYLAECIITKSFSATQLLSKFIVFNTESYFIQCYLMLMFLSPILNTYIQSHNRKNILRYSLIFTIVAFLFDCLFNNKCLAFGHGYQLTHFILIYMLARTAYLYKNRLIDIKTKVYIYGYLACTIAIAALRIAEIPWAYHYTNPFNIVAAFCLFMPFVKKEFYNKTINSIARSVFAVYIIHITYPMIHLLIKYDTFIYTEYSYILYFPIMLASTLIVFFTGTLYDKARAYLTEPVTNRIYECIKNKLINHISLNNVQ